MAEGKLNKVGFIVVIVLLSALIIGVLIGRSIASSSLTNLTNDMEIYIKDNHSNLGFVKNGLDMTAVSEDISKVNTVITDLRTAVWPHAKEIGLPRIIYDNVLDSMSTNLRKKITEASNKVNSKNSFTDENNFLTVSSLLNGIRLSVMKVVNVIAIILILIFAIILTIHIIKSLKTLKAIKNQ